MSRRLSFDLQEQMVDEQAAKSEPDLLRGHWDIILNERHEGDGESAMIASE
jgi:hypothetical protein